MRKIELAEVLLRAKTMDPRVNNTPEAVDSWWEVLPEAMTQEWAYQYLAGFYGSHDDMLLPSHLVVGWKVHTAGGAEFLNPRHCGRVGCECSHEDPCFKGWVDAPRGGLAEGAATQACGVCRGEQAARLRIRVWQPAEELPYVHGRDD